MSNGWRAFREASKHKAIAETAAEELDRPAVSHRISLPLLPIKEGAETTPEPDAAAAAELPPDVAAWTAPEGRRGRWLNRLKAMPRDVAPWYVLAIVPVAAVASLIAVRAGVNPYALCLQWWDVLFGTLFVTALVLFLGLALWKGSRRRWHPGAPALVIALGVLPLWIGTDLALGTGCPVIAPEPILVPPLPPPIEVPTLPSLWPAPMPQPRPPGL